jgi:uncharacterized phage protein (TIGR01671 family)
MKREIRFKIYLQHEDTGVITSKEFDYAAIFSGAAMEYIKIQLPRYFIIGKAEYTGQNDINDVKIFEGDIVQSICKKILKDELEGDDMFCLPKIEDRTYNNVIDWYDGVKIAGWRIKGKRFQTQLKWSTVGNMNLKVVGNIFENPELLEAVA